LRWVLDRLARRCGRFNDITMLFTRLFKSVIIELGHLEFPVVEPVAW